MKESKPLRDRHQWQLIFSCIDIFTSSFLENGIETAWQRNGAISVKTEISSPKNGGRIQKEWLGENGKIKGEIKR